MADCEMVLVVDGNGDYGVGRDIGDAKANYETNVGDLGDADGGFRVVWVKVAVPVPTVVELTGEAPETAGAATLTVQG